MHVSQKCGTIVNNLHICNSSTPLRLQFAAMLPSGGNPNFDGAPHRRRLVSGPSAPPLSHNSSSSDSHMTESSGMMIPMNQHDALAYQNTPNMGMAPMGMAQAEQEWWSATGYMPSLNTSMDQMAELQLQQTQSHSPITVDDYAGRRSSIHSNSDLADWQEKVRVEVSFPIISDYTKADSSTPEEKGTEPCCPKSVQGTQRKGTDRFTRHARQEGLPVSSSSERPQSPSGAVQRTACCKARVFRTFSHAYSGTNRSDFITIASH